MANSASAAGFSGLCAGIMALEVYCFLDPQSGAGAMSASEAPLLDSALELLLPLGAAAGLCAAVAYIYRHLSHDAVPAAHMRESGVVIFVLCASTGVLDYLLFVHPAGGVDHGAQARALGLAAHRALPAAAAAAFFWGMMLIIIGHVRSGGEGGGGGGAGAGHGANQGTVRRVVNNIALGAAAGLVFLVTMALCVE